MTIRDIIREKQLKIYELKRKLTATDYKAIKYACDEISYEEFAPVKKQRLAWRAEINALETEISDLRSVE